MDLRSQLDEMGIRYNWLQHSAAYTARSLASRERVAGEMVVKPVLVKASGDFFICALPASHRVNLDLLRLELGAEDADLASEEELSQVFCDCELGAEPPVGWLFGLPTLMDESLLDDQQVIFQAGTHCDAVRMKLMDYFRLAQPVVGHFGQRIEPERQREPVGQA